MPIIRVGRDQVAGLIAGTGAAYGTGAYMFVSSSTAGHSAASSWFGPAGASPSCMEATYPIRTNNILEHRRGQFRVEPMGHPQRDGLGVREPAESLQPVLLHPEDQPTVRAIHDLRDDHDVRRECA